MKCIPERECNKQTKIEKRRKISSENGRNIEHREKHYCIFILSITLEQRANVYDAIIFPFRVRNYKNKEFSCLFVVQM